MKTIKQMISIFEKQLINTKKQLKQHNKNLLDYAQVLREYAQYLYNTQTFEHEIEAAFLARKAIRCYGRVYRSDPKKYQATYACILVEWFDYMNLNEDYDEGIRLAEKALAFYQSLLVQYHQQYLPTYAKLLTDYGYCLYKAEHEAKAQKILAESLSFYKTVVKKDSTQSLAYCYAQYRYAQSLQATDKKQAHEVISACLVLLKQEKNQQNLAFKAQQVNTLELYVKLLDDDLTALTQSEQLHILYRELISLDLKSYARNYANFLVGYANLSESNVWTDGYDGFYEDSPRLALADKLLAEAVTVREQLIATGAIYENWGYIRILKRYTEFLLEESHYDRALIMAKKAMDSTNKIFKKENTLIATRSMDELNYARICQLYAQALDAQGQCSKAAKIALQGIFWYEQLTLIDPYDLEELCTGLYEPEDYTNALQSIGYYLENIGDTQQALIYYEKAYHLAKLRYDKHPSWHHLERYLWIFNDYINQLTDNGHIEQSLVYSNELLAIAVKHYETKKSRGSYLPILVHAYGNNAYVLAHNKRYEEALMQTKKALACNGLAFLDSEGYEKNKAWLLHNLGCYQNNLCEAGHGLNNAKKSLAIRLKLFEENPLRFLSALQRAHGNCAFILTELGKLDEALEHRKHILALDKKYQFTSSWFDRFEVKWLSWLNGKKIKPFKVINMVDKKLDSRTQQELNFTQYWLLTCFTQSHDYLTRALYYLIHMDQDLQKDYLEESVILMSLLKQRGWFLPESLQLMQNWQADYQRYIKQRKGFIPRWMITAAEKLGIVLPIIS